MNLLKINSINLWDEEWRNGYWRYSTGGFVSASNQMCSKNMIDVVPSSVIYIKTPATLNNNVCFYNANGSYVSGLFYDGNSSITVPSNAYKMHINFGTECGATYANNIQICLNSATEKTIYHPHWVLAQDGQGKAVTADIASLLPSGIGVVDLGGLNWEYFNPTGHLRFKSSAISDIITGTQNGVPQILCEPYTADTDGNVYGNVRNKSITVMYTLKNLMVYDTTYTDATTFKNAMSGVLLFYKKA